MSLDIQAREQSGWQVLILAGRLDAHGAPELFDHIESLLASGGSAPSLALDLAAVDYVSSAGLRVLLRVLKSTGRRQGRMCLVSVPAPVYDVLSVAGLIDLIEVQQALDETGGTGS